MNVSPAGATPRQRLGAAVYRAAEMLDPTKSVVVTIARIGPACPVSPRTLHSLGGTVISKWMVPRPHAERPAPGSGADFTWNLVRVREVEFCIWALIFDGLRVLPWDHHSAGNGTLRALGLDQDNWRAWLAHSVDRYREQARPAYPPTDQAQARDLLRRMDRFLEFWSDDTPIHAQLTRRWAMYRLANAAQPLFQGPTYSYSYWQTQPNALGMALVDTCGLAEGAPRGTRRWNPGGPSVWSLRFLVVRYPVSVAHLLPPDTVIIGSPTGDLRGRALSRLAARAARDLSAHHRHVRG